MSENRQSLILVAIIAAFAFIGFGIWKWLGEETMKAVARGVSCFIVSLFIVLLVWLAILTPRRRETLTPSIFSMAMMGLVLPSIVAWGMFRVLALPWMPAMIVSGFEGFGYFLVVAILFGIMGETVESVNRRYRPVYPAQPLGKDYMPNAPALPPIAHEPQMPSR
jgi:ethanolamine transporter EutH